MNFKEKLINVFNKYNISLSDKEIIDFETFYIEMLKYNKLHNITNITDEDEIITKHFLDSVLTKDLFLDNTKVLDIGCGAGFPSIPLKIIKNSLFFTAIDSVNKKIDFVSQIVTQLGLNNFNTIHTRIEDIAHNNNYRESFDYVISRAVASLNTILEYSAPMLKNGGYIVCYKGPKYLEEINDAQNALKLLNCEIIDIKKYNIEENSRYILIIRKNNTIDNKYPRNNNKPRLKPL